MCTVILLHRPGHGWPVLIAANRDERLDRAWDPPGAWWPDHPDLLGGRDRSAGGTWMALNQAGVAAAILNRPGSLGPAPDKRSRGELPLIALSGARDAAEAARRIAGLPAGEWRPFNMVIADRQGGVFLRGTGAGRPDAVTLGPGISMVTAHDPNDPASLRTRRHLPRFRAAPPPQPEQGDWSGWEALLADDSFEESPAEALCVPTLGGFGTVSAALVGLGADGGRVWRFAAGPPGRALFQPIFPAAAAAP
jgi:hypothetical protein